MGFSTNNQKTEDGNNEAKHYLKLRLLKTITAKNPFMIKKNGKKDVDNQEEMNHLQQHGIMGLMKKNKFPTFGMIRILKK